jgi:hypothetical protein
MARTSITLPSRTHRAWVVSMAAGGAVVIVVAAAAWVLIARAGDSPNRSASAVMSPSAASQGPRTDPIPVNAWAVNEAMLVIEGYLESVNRGEAAGALAALAPDAAFISSRCQPACIGTAAIGPSLEDTTASHSQLTLTDPRVEGETLTAGFSVVSPEFPDGVQRVIGTTTAVVRNQKIVLMSMNWDATDPQTATMLNTQDQ